MSKSTIRRPAVISEELVGLLAPYLAFRRLFRGASIALMQWEKLAPLLSQFDAVHRRIEDDFNIFLEAMENPRN